MDAVPEPSSLAEERRELARTRIVGAARAVMVERGLAATMDEVAAAARVSPRTVFRHFGTHEQLMAAALEEMFAGYEEAAEHWVRGPDGDVDAWLEQVVTSTHTLQASMLGRAIWDVRDPRAHVEPALLEVRARRNSARRRVTKALADVAWRAAGGFGGTPGVVADALGLCLFGFVAEAVASDGMGPEFAGHLGAALLRAFLASEVARSKHNS